MVLERARNINRLRVVLRYVNHLRIRRLDYDHLLTARCCLVLDLLLRSRLEISCRLCLRPQALNGTKNSVFVIRESLAQLRCPVRFLDHHLDDLREWGKRYVTSIEPRLLGGALEFASFQVAVSSIHSENDCSALTFVDATRICAISASGYNAMGAVRLSTAIRWR